MWNALVNIPLQVVCQLLISGQNGTENAPFAVDSRFPETTKPKTVLPEGYVPFPDIGVAYKYYTDEGTWNYGRKTCIEEGSSLAVLDTFEKIKYASEVKKETEIHALSVGIHRLFDDSEWTNLKTGKEVSMIPWASDSDDAVPENKCLFMYYDGRGLKANVCSLECRFICEIPLPVDWK